MEDSETRALIGELRAGSKAAFDRVYHAEKSIVYGFLLRLAADPHVAADLFQNVWLKLARHSARLRPDTNIRAWLMTVARNEHVSHRRAQLVDLSRLLTIGREPPDPTPHTPPGLSDCATALAALSDSDREVLLATSVDGLSNERAAAVLGISEPALRQRLSRARKRLATELERLADEPASTQAKGRNA